LGRLCIKHEVSVSELAKELHVSRMTIYNWFWGLRTPTIHLQPRVIQYIEHLKKRK
jgi:DNA-binding XRE family transcriptional regulator